MQIQRSIPQTNSAGLLRLLYQRGNRSRADLARASGLTKATVSSLIAELLELGLVRETRQRPVEGPGRPSVELDVARTEWNVLCLDLSHDEELRGALLDLGGNIHERVSVLREGSTGEAAVVKTKRLVDALLARAPGRVLGIGVGSPGVVDTDGVVITSHNLGWYGVQIRAELHAHTGLPVSVENDANASALAELSTMENVDDLLLVKIGVGVGAAIVANGRVIHGPRFSAGEIGHVAIGDGSEGPECVCGRRGCLEATLSWPRLAERLRTAADAPERDEILRAAGERLGVALAPLVGSLGLSSVIVSGPPETLDGTLLAATRQAMKPALTADLFEGLELRATELGDEVVLQGALILVLGEVLDIV